MRLLNTYWVGILYTLSILCGSIGFQAHAQCNLVQNGSFESITQPVTGGGQIHHATYWGWSVCGFPNSSGNYHSPDLFDVNFVWDPNSIGSNYVEIPMNKWTTNLPEKNGWERYAGISYDVPANIGSPVFDERVFNQLLYPLPEGMGYRFSVCFAYGDDPSLNGHENRVQLVLKEDNTPLTDCSAEKIIYTTPHITHTGWVKYEGVFDISAADDARFTVLEVRMKVPDVYVPSENLQIFMDDFEICPPPGHLELKGNPICEGSDVIVGASDILLCDEDAYIITVQDVTPNAPSPNIMQYYGCGNPGLINLSDPATSNLFDYTGITDCPNPQGSFTPYPFDCDEYCSYYEIRIDYELCGVPRTDAVIVHILCGPEVSANASPMPACPGDPITYCVDNPQSFIDYVWYDQNGPLASFGNACTGPHPLDLSNPVYVVGTDQSTGCESSYTPEISLSDDCLDCPDNIVVDGQFEFVDPTCLAANPTNPFGMGCLSFWENAHGKPTLNPGINNYSAEMAAKMTFLGPRGHGIMTDATMPIGFNLEGNIDVYTNGIDGELIILAANNVVGTNNTSIPNYSGQVLWLIDLSGYSAGWHSIPLNTVVVAGNNFSQLLIYPFTNSSTPFNVEVDNICIQRVAVDCDVMVDAGPDFNLCHTLSAELEAMVSGGVGPYSYDWNPTTHLSNPTGAVTGFSPINIGTYHYTITVTDANGCVDIDSIQIQVIPCGERKGTIQEARHFHFYPNPASSKLRLDYQIEAEGMLSLYDLTGKTVLSQPLQAEKQAEIILLNGLAPGLYLARILTEGKLEYQEKIIIQR